MKLNYDVGELEERRGGRKREPRPDLMKLTLVQEKTEGGDEENLDHGCSLSSLLSSLDGRLPSTIITSTLSRVYV